MCNNKLEEIDIKSFTRYYFDVIININYLNLTNALFAEKSYGSFLIYDVASKSPDGTQPLHFIFDKVSLYISTYDRTKYLRLFHSGEKHERVSDRVRNYFKRLLS